MHEPFLYHQRFTDRARYVMKLAKQEAQRFCHDSICTEHILLAVVDEGRGVAAHVLANLKVDIQEIRLEVEKSVQQGPTVVTGEISLSPMAESTIEFAWEESRNLHHNYVGTEHLLMGMLHEEEGIAVRVLKNLGLKLDDFRREVVTLLGMRIAQ